MPELVVERFSFIAEYFVAENLPTPFPHLIIVPFSGALPMVTIPFRGRLSW